MYENTNFYGFNLLNQTITEVRNLWDIFRALRKVTWVWCLGFSCILPAIIFKLQITLTFDYYYVTNCEETWRSIPPPPQASFTFTRLAWPAQMGVPQIPQNRHIPCCAAKCHMQHWPAVGTCSMTAGVQMHQWCLQAWLEHATIMERFQIRTDPKLPLGKRLSFWHPPEKLLKEASIISTSPEWWFLHSPQLSWVVQEISSYKSHV